MKTFLNRTTFLGAYRVFKVHHRPSNLRWVRHVRTSGDAWTNTDACDASFSVTLNSSTSTTCSGKRRICRLLSGGGELSLSSAGAAVLTSPCDRSAFLQRALPGSGCSPIRYPPCTPCTRSFPSDLFCCISCCLRLSGDLLGVLEFPFLGSHTFHGGCCARWNTPFEASCFLWGLNLPIFVLLSALLGFLLLMATVRLKSGFSLEHFGVWIFMSKVMVLHVFTFIERVPVISDHCLSSGYHHLSLPVYIQHGSQCSLPPLVGPYFQQKL